MFQSRKISCTCFKLWFNTVVHLFCRAFTNPLGTSVHNVKQKVSDESPFTRFILWNIDLVLSKTLGRYLVFGSASVVCETTIPIYDPKDKASCNAGMVIKEV